MVTISVTSAREKTARYFNEKCVREIDGDVRETDGDASSTVHPLGGAATGVERVCVCVCVCVCLYMICACVYI